MTVDRVNPEWPTIEVKGGGRFISTDTYAQLKIIDAVPHQAIADFLTAIGLDGTKRVVRVVIEPQGVEVTVKAEDALGMAFSAYSDSQPRLGSGLATFSVLLPIEHAEV